MTRQVIIIYCTTDSSANQPDSPVDDDTDELSSNKNG